MNHYSTWGFCAVC